MLAAISVSSLAAPRTASDELILPPSIDLERKTQPWCPDECIRAIPFIANYQKGGERLIFVGAFHAFEPGHPTMRAVAAAFAARRPDVVIVEGFPSGMGENPPPLVEMAKLHGTPDAPEFARGEAIYAASLALSSGIPFQGGEPSFAEQLDALKLQGFTDAEIAFGSLLGWYSQTLRSGGMPDTSMESLEANYSMLAGNVSGQWQLDAPTLGAFQRRYRDLYGCEISNDKEFTVRTDAVFDNTRQGELSKAMTTVRDRHLWSLIADHLTQKKSLLVVYGGSHWSTMSVALRGRLGEPEVTPFPK